MNPEQWPQLFLQYGPFAFLVFFVFVTEAKLREIRASGQEPRWLFVGLYAGNWMIVFALVGIATWAWWTSNIRSGVELAGMLRGLRATESIVSRADDLFLRRVYLPGNQVDYEWRIYSKAALPDGKRVPLLLDQSTCDSEKTTAYELEIAQSFYADRPEIRYNRQKDTLEVKIKDKWVALRKTDADIASVAIERPRHPWLVASAHAETAFDDRQFEVRLQADDPIVRQEARASLAKYGEAAVPWINKTLSEGKMPYRLNLGILVALGAMDPKPRSQLSDKTFAAIVSSVASPDKSLHAAARKVLVLTANQTPDRSRPILDLVESSLAGPAAAKEPGKALISEAAREVFYNYGIGQKDLFGEHPKSDGARIDEAVAYFKKAWDLRTNAPEADRAPYAKALFGWGLALSDRWTLERNADGARNPATQQAAVAKFKEFVAAIDALPDGATYPWPDHVAKAKKYIRDPRPESLR
jgi:hypothetical protein